MRTVAEITETVLFYDTDCGGVVSNIAYLRYIEKARTALFSELGMELPEMMQSGLFPAVIRTEIDYLRPARLGESIAVVARLESVERARANCDFTLSAGLPGAEPSPVAKARQVVALVQMPEGRPRRMPAEWLSLIQGDFR